MLVAMNCSKKNLTLTSKFLQHDSLLSLACNTAEIIFKANSKIRQLLVGFLVTFNVKTFTAKTQTRQTFVAMLNSTRHTICTRPCVYI